ncbi:Yap1 redox domain protein [Cordyceps fumosorosea ARSEF 2679]|uniref:Yap1 redox domain protein n=1 Tax=Cordyceps fumosorosea (strain ARSEF 2679) TaxID=1081104 RepID=A0A168D717_CORFA|nr:Yap1 redox domain protein [Cordyceps fumosorosea ARSEF 2679]OAA72241.1 Yap1 redox domain protein [Cordyceps fumosorosea ARSEF 2679]
MDFSSQYQYGASAGAAATANGQQVYGFLGPMQPLTPSHSASAGSEDFGGHTSPPEGFDATALAGDDFSGYDYGSTGLTPGNLHGAFPGPPTPPNPAAGAFASVAQQQPHGIHVLPDHQQHQQKQHSPDDGQGARANSDDEELTPAQSRRKAQNRAAQRAFRERKERHVKDLETKLAGLEAAQQQASVENEQLRRDLAKMSTENEILRATSSLPNQHQQSHHHQSSASPPIATTTGPAEYHPTDFYSNVLRGHGSADQPPSHRVVVGDDGARLFAAGATWDYIVSHELFRRGLVDVGGVAERLRSAARCDGQGPVFPEAAILAAIEQSVAGGSDDLL